ncbi:MAG TPA: c-type cytochrome [Vicinamibacterales bacterium]|nr:c-type cytochrome [Vicinamibacterales bacterium]
MTRSASLLVVLLLTLAARPFAQDQPAPAAQGAASPAAKSESPADEDWVPEKITNLKVLPKDIPPKELMRIMRIWSEVLRVECVFCHVGKRGAPLSTYDFASDDKTRKETTRIMVRAVVQMNEQFKAIEMDQPPSVMCSTCHKRSRHVDSDLPPLE